MKVREKTNSKSATFVVLAFASLSATPRAQEQDASDPAPTRNEIPVRVQVVPGCVEALQPAQPLLTARITADDLIDLVLGTKLSIQFEAERNRQATVDALEKVAMGAIIDKLSDYLISEFEGRFDPSRDIVFTPVPEDKQVTIDTPDLDTPTHRGPTREVLGLLLHDVTESELTEVALRFIQTARQALDSGDASADRLSPSFYRALAEAEVARKRAIAAESKAASLEQRQMRDEVADALGLKLNANAEYEGNPDWLRESRRFSYIIREGKFINRLEPLVERINTNMESAGFLPPSRLDRPGIYYDGEIGDVEIVLPKPMLIDFLKTADSFERRMAEDALISIEAVRLTDRDIITGALASRLSAQIQGVHDSKTGFSSRTVLRELGLNSLLAVANQQLQAQALGAVAAGTLPAGVTPVQVAPPTLPAIDLTRRATTLGSTFSVGADPIFFDGSQQVYGFSYRSPDGVDHTLSLEVVDNLRETWERIERNLIVHKIKKTDTLTPFSVPVGPETKTYNGIAALISQENQQLIVATGTGAISEISATAGTWLVIENFEITPIPGSSTTLTEDEKQDLQAKVLLTMFLRDPSTGAGFKRDLLASSDRTTMHAWLFARLDEARYQPIRSGRGARTYGDVFDERYAVTVDDARYEKREKNSVITLTFYSSQGNIIQSPGSTQLGDANDLTSFTTELRPNIVTPISSFFTKSGSNTVGSSPLTGADKGQQKQETKSMTHLVIRARFPTIGREREDRNEGRFTGYFELPISRRPSSEVDLPFLSSSQHPVERLAKLRVGLMFDALDRRKVRKPLAALNPQKFPGSVRRRVWEVASTRMLMNRKLVSDSPGATEALASDFGERFLVEVRSLLEYDENFFEAPGFALRNMTQWNDPDRIRLALSNSPGRFALERLVRMLDELGEQLIPDVFAEGFLAVCPTVGWGDRRIYPLTAQQLNHARRDVAIHYMRFREFYGDAFLEAVSNLLGLGTYRAESASDLTSGPFHGYTEFVLFDNGGHFYSDPSLYDDAQEQFLFLKGGGYQGRLFEASMLSLEHLPANKRSLIYRGTDILALANKKKS